MKRLSLFVTLVAASITAALAFGAASASAATCTPTGYQQDGTDLTAAYIGTLNVGDANNHTDLDATGCDIGVYGSALHVDVHGARYYGVLANGLPGSFGGTVYDNHVYDIGDLPSFSGNQHGVGIKLQDSSGLVGQNTVSQYQKNGIVVTGSSTAYVENNTVTGRGKLTTIAQNGVEFLFGAGGTAKDNAVSDLWYNDSPDAVTACGLLFIESGAVKSSGNKYRNDETNLCNFGQRGGGNFTP